MTALTHKEMTTHIRSRIKASGIKARVIGQRICDENRITIATPSYEVRFTSKELRDIAIIASANRLTMVMGVAIDINHIDRLTAKNEFVFVYN